MINNNCKLCNSENISLETETITIGKGTNAVSLDVEYILCTNCDESFYTKGSESKINKARSDYKRKEQGLLTGDEIKQFRKSIGLNQINLSKMLGMSEKTVTRYEGGYTIQSQAVDEHLRFMIENKDRTIVKAKRLGYLPDNVITFNFAQYFQSGCNNDVFDTPELTNFANDEQCLDQLVCGN